MTGADTLDFARESIYLLLTLAAPAMLTALVVGVAIGILQALTQIQEMTLAFVPKIIVMCAVMILAMPFMLSSLALFTQELAGRIANVGAG